MAEMIEAYHRRNEAEVKRLRVENDRLRAALLDCIKTGRELRRWLGSALDPGDGKIGRLPYSTYQQVWDTSNRAEQAALRVLHSDGKDK